MDFPEGCFLAFISVVEPMGLLLISDALEYDRKHIHCDLLDIHLLPVSYPRCPPKRP